MSHRTDGLCNELDEVTRAVRTTFGALSPEQLDWRPAGGGWSVGQCLDHLITINTLYFPLLASLQAGPPAATFWERHSPFSGVLGRMLIRTSGPEYARRIRTRPKAEPSGSPVGRDILRRFAAHQAELVDHVRRIPDGVDLGKTVVTSPLLGWVTYSLDDCLTLLVVHERRHLQQAVRLLEAEGFPRGTGQDAEPGPAGAAS